MPGSNIDFSKNAALTGHGVNLSTRSMLWNEYPSTADYSYVNPDLAIGGHQETNPDVCVAGPVSTPPSTGTEVFKPCQPLLFSSSNRSCTQVVTFLYGRLSFCSGTAPEGKAERTIKAAGEPETCKTY